MLQVLGICGIYIYCVCVCIYIYIYTHTLYNIYTFVQLNINHSNIYYIILLVSFALLL